MTWIDATDDRPVDLGEGTTSATVDMLASLRVWWSRRAEATGLDGDWLEVEYAVDARPPSPLPPPSEVPDHGLDVLEMGQAYVATLTTSSRSLHGRHYTPQPLAFQLWQMAREALGWPKAAQQLPGLVRDPAAGCGALLVAPLREHLEASASADPSMLLTGLPSRIEGVEGDPWAAYVGSVLLASELLPILAKVPARLRKPLPSLITFGDGLNVREPSLVNIQNPPYGRIGLSPEQRSSLGDVLYGHANLYGIFMAAGARSITQEGVLATLVPTSFTAGLYFHKLRRVLSDERPLRAISFVEQRSGVFAGVLQETCLAVFTARRHRAVKVTRSNGQMMDVASLAVPRSEAPWVMPREPGDAILAATAARLPLTLADSGWRASTGPLVWNRRKEDLRKRSSKSTATVIWASDFTADGLDLSEARGDKRYLRLAKPSDSRVMLLETPAVFVQRTTAPEQSRRLVAAHFSEEHLRSLGRVVVENHVNVLRPTRDEQLLSAELLTSLLNSSTFDRLIRCVAGSVAVSSYELATLPLPSASTLREWELLTADELDRAVAQTYGTRLAP